MKHLILVTILIFAIVLVFAQAEKPKNQTTCPISGEKIDKKVFIDYQGQRIYFCCDKCKAKFEKEPEKYFEKLEKEHVVLENVQTSCPTCEMKLEDKKIFTDYKGRRIYVCSDHCLKEFKKDPAKYLEKTK